MPENPVFLLIQQLRFPFSYPSRWKSQVIGPVFDVCGIKRLRDTIVIWQMWYTGDPEKSSRDEPAMSQIGCRVSQNGLAPGIEKHPRFLRVCWQYHPIKTHNLVCVL